MRAHAWLTLCAVLAAGSVLAWWVPASLLDWQPGRALAEPWRLFTAAWVHWSAWHLGANLAGTGVVALLGLAARLPARAALALALAWPFTQAGLWVEPALAHYGGASGVLHAAVAIAACWLVAGGSAGGSAGGAAGGDADGARGGTHGVAIGGANGRETRPMHEVQAQRRSRLIGAAIGLGLVLKVVLEAPWAGPLASSRAWDIAVAPIAHASGALAGTVAALVALALRPRPMR